MNRRGFITGALAAPAVVVTPGLLMPVRSFTPTADMVQFATPKFRMSWPYLTTPEQAKAQAIYSAYVQSMKGRAVIARRELGEG